MNKEDANMISFYSRAVSMNRVKVTIDWFKDYETLFVQEDCTDLIDTGSGKIKEYNRITTPGEVGTAVKDFMMELEGK